MSVWIGSYTHLMYGLSGDTLAQEVLHSTHTEQVTCAAASGGLLATGSSDTTVWVFKTRSKREVGVLQRHTGAITGLAFSGSRHLLSSSSDGTVCVWRTKDWECLLQIKAHKGGVRSLALHPSGRMALTLGHQSRKARLWNLMTGKQAVLFRLEPGTASFSPVPVEKGGEKTHLPRDHRDMPQLVRWSPTGALFVVLWTAQADVYSASGSTKTPLRVLSFEARTTCAAFGSESVLAVGTEDGAVVWWDPSTGEQRKRVSVGARVKEVAFLEPGKMVCITSAGTVHLFGEGEEEAIAKTSLDDRLTCMAVLTRHDEQEADKQGEEEEEAQKKKPRKKKAKAAVE